MKTKLVKILKISIIPILLFVVFIFAFDNYYMPWYVEAPEVELPDLTGLHKDEAVKILEDLHLNPILGKPRYDVRYEVDHIMFQNPAPGKKVKENRRVYLFVSGGEQMAKMPNLRQKTFRDAKITLERLGLYIRDAEPVKSELPAETIVDQQYEEGTLLAKGDSIDIKVSIGPRIGMISVPSIIARSLSEAEKILKRNNLFIGSKTYIESPLLTNTVVDQSPGEGSLLNVGDSVDVWIAKSK